MENFALVFQNTQGEDVGKNHISVLQPVAQQLHAAVDAIAHGVAVDEQNVGGASQAFGLLQIDLEGNAQLGIVRQVVGPKLLNLLMAVKV